MLFLLLALAAQTPDSLRADTVRRLPTPLPELTVSVTRRVSDRDRLPAAVTVVGGEEIAGGRLGVGLDEALGGLAGIHVADRANFSLDQRFSLRGFGSRANFGLRGVKVLLDGVPQTLPDGQSQLTNVDLSDVARIEVHRGAAAALYGNASGGVLSLETYGPPDSLVQAGWRVLYGAHSTFKGEAWVGARVGRVGLSASQSGFWTDGYRNHSAARARQTNLRLDAPLGGGWSTGLRVRIADAPRAENPGALTLSEVSANPRTAAPNNVARAADKAVGQDQLSLTVRHQGRRGRDASLTLFGLWRDLDNPIAAPPPGPFVREAGTFNRIDRTAGGARLAVTTPLGSAAPVLLAGVDLQLLRDDRVNLRALAGVPTDSVLADQRERVTELGPFARLDWSRGPWTLTGGVRWDRLTFRVEDRHFTDGADQSGRRVMQAGSWQAGVSLRVSEAFIPWAAVASAFETPTTTELVNEAGGRVGFNTALDPQRATTVELGVRGRVAALRWEATGFSASVRDALVQQQEMDGRASFANAGRTRQRGLEVSVTATPSRGLDLSAAWTFADYTFRNYRIQRATAVDTLDGNQLPAVPRHQLRLSLRGALGPLLIGADQIITPGLFADDRNLLRTEGSGAGITDVRVHMVRASPLPGRFRPFLGVRNLWDRRHVGSVTINGFGGRVFEPSPGRSAYVGVEWGAGR